VDFLPGAGQGGRMTGDEQTTALKPQPGIQWRPDIDRVGTWPSTMPGGRIRASLPGPRIRHILTTCPWRWQH